MAQFEHIAIIGLGLIGGSFALALREAGFDGKISGWDARENLAFALKSAIIDRPEESFSRGEQCQADLIYLAMPIGEIINFLSQNCNQIKPGALVSDCGSTKRAICEAAAQLPSDVDFIGGHPMAGSEQRGLAAARGDLFQRAVYLLVPRPGILEARMLQFELMLRAIGALPRQLTATFHDEAVALVSHLPQLLSTALVSTIAEHKGNLEPLSLAGRGFKDMSRLAGSSWAVWQDICATNRDFLSVALGDLIDKLNNMRESLSDEQMVLIAKDFSAAESAIKKTIAD